MRNIIYFDNNATTQPLPEVIEAVDWAMREGYANPSSVHQFGQSVRHRVELAREQVAGLIGAKAKEVVFTSCGTESINSAVRGVLAAHPKRRKIVTTAVEHSAMHKLSEQLIKEGYEVVTVGVDSSGALDIDALAAAVDDATAVVSVMWANNETGVLFDVARVAKMTSERGVPLHLDAVQAAGKVAIDVGALPVDLLSISGHKFHGPKGVGALYLRRRTRWQPMFYGGGQEREMRAGTENVPGVIGMGVAAQAAARRVADGCAQVGQLRDVFERRVLASVSYAKVIGGDEPRVPNTTNIAFESLEAEAILIVLSEQGICASAGSACSSGSLEPSHVLKAMGVEEKWAHGAIRFSFSHFNSMEEVDRVAGQLPELLGRLAALSR